MKKLIKKDARTSTTNAKEVLAPIESIKNFIIPSATKVADAEQEKNKTSSFSQEYLPGLNTNFLFISQQKIFAIIKPKAVLIDANIPLVAYHGSSPVKLASGNPRYTTAKSPEAKHLKTRLEAT